MISGLYPLRLYIKHLPNLVLISVGFLVNIGAWFWLIFHAGAYEEFIFLHYNALYGVDLIGPWFHVYFVPAIGLLILIANAVIGWFFFHKDKFVGYVLNFFSTLCQIFLLIASSLLVFLNV